jgi:hypothetical protein
MPFSTIFQLYHGSVLLVEELEKTLLKRCWGPVVDRSELNVGSNDSF